MFLWGFLFCVDLFSWCLIIIDIFNAFLVLTVDVRRFDVGRRKIYRLISSCTKLIIHANSLSNLTRTDVIKNNQWLFGWYLWRIVKFYFIIKYRRSIGIEGLTLDRSLTGVFLQVYIWSWLLGCLSKMNLIKIAKMSIRWKWVYYSFGTATAIRTGVGHTFISRIAIKCGIWGE